MKWPRTVGASAASACACALATSLLVLFVVWPAQSFVDTRSDPYNYATIARQMLQDGFAAHGLTKREASLYPMAIAGVYAIVGEQPLLITLAQCGLFAATCILTVLIGARLFNVRTGLCAGLLLALNPLPLRYVADFHMETLLIFVVTLNVWMMVRFRDRPTIANGALVGLTAGVAALTKGVTIVPPLVFGVWWVVSCLRAWWRRASPPASWAAVLTIAIATAVVIAPWTARNYRVTGGRFVLLAPGFSDAFLRGYIFSRAEYALLQRPPYVDAENACNDWFKDICRRAGAEFGRDEVLDEAILGAVVRDKIVNDPLDTLRKIVVGLATFWYQMTTRLTSLVAAMIALGSWLVAAPGLLRARREARPLWVVLLPIVSMNVAIALLCSLGRYSMPIVPCLMVLTAFGLDTILDARARACSGLDARARAQARG